VWNESSTKFFLALFKEILEESKMRRKKSGDFQKKFLDLQEKIAINKIPAKKKEQHFERKKCYIAGTEQIIKKPKFFIRGNFVRTKTI